MKKALLILLACVLALPAAASAKARKAAIMPEPIELKRSLFSGSESRLYDFGWLKSDCTVETPEVRIVRPPGHGNIRFEENKSIIAGERTSLQKLCHGKTVEALRLFYMLKSDFTGTDRFVVDVDTKLGWIKRYSFVVEVR